MKVLMIHDHDCWLEEGPDALQAHSRKPGGIGIYLTAIINGLLGRDWDVAAVRYESAHQPGPSDPAVPPQYTLESGSLRLRGNAIDSLKRVIDREQPDLVHLHSVYFAMHPQAIEELRHWVPTVQTIHDVTPICFRRTKLLSDGTLCTRAAGAGCVSSGCFRPGDDAGAARDALRVLNNARHLQAFAELPMTLVPSIYLRDELERNGFAPQKLRVVPLFSRFTPDSPAEPMTAKNPPTILYVGRLVAEKGILALLDALVLLGQRPWNAMIVGDGPALGDAMMRAARRGLADRIHFIPATDAGGLANRYRAADIVVVPSLIPESFNLVGVEAMSFARPVVAFDAGGIRTWLIPEETGIMAPHGDVIALAKGIARLLTDPSLRRRMGTCGQAIVQAGFTLNRHLDQLVSCYEELIGSPVEQGVPS